MYLQKVISRKNCVEKTFFAGILKVSDENSRMRIRIQDPDPLVRGMDPRIRIHPKMSWIRNTVGIYCTYIAFHRGDWDCIEVGDLRSVSRFSNVGKITLGQDIKMEPMPFSFLEKYFRIRKHNS